MTSEDIKHQLIIIIIIIISVSVLPRSTLKQQCELFLGKLRYNVLALVPDRADVVLCQT